MMMFSSGLPGKNSTAPQCHLKLRSASAFPPNIYTVRPLSSNPGTQRKVGVPRKKRRPHTACSFPSGHRRDLLSDDEYDRSDSSRWGDKSARSPRVASHTVFSDFSDDIFSDSGWDTDLEVEDPPSSPDFSGTRVYKDSCQQLGVIPASYFLRHLDDAGLYMTHHGLGPKNVKPIAIALVSNPCIQELNLSDNWLGDEGGHYICDMLRENMYISDLNLSENKLGAAFARDLCQVLAVNVSLTHLNLSGNWFDDEAAVYLATAVTKTTKIEYLNLSGNKLGPAAGVILGPALAENSSIRNLDLSWNGLSHRGAISIANGIKLNVLMSSINLAWNGFGMDGAKALGDALKVNSALTELHIPNNRITTEGAVLLGKGLTVNDSLRVLKMGKNPMCSPGCYAIVAAILKNDSSIIEDLDFSDIPVNNDFKELLVQLREQRPDIRVNFHGEATLKKQKQVIHPMTKLRNFIERKNIRLLDFFNMLDTDHSMSITRQEFSEGIQKSGINLSEEEVVILLDFLDKDGDGEIDYR
ncbi:hypothetical protein NP493_401g02028 [Ridgeia piscesae]|uniref:EF-hand domain-containing protein n=1 Tax=Ridgeia piscesae TaxID=27915 RepID=A0AAD9L112_RIDPI|nr:hypothetical protein NP493_401g02028 [Ridgeia piscesae]